MKKLVFFLAVIFVFLNSRNAVAQGTDRTVSESGNVIILETGKLWSNTSQINYIFRPPFTYTLANLYIRNHNNTNAHNPTITIQETSDAFVSGFSGQSSNWNGDQNIGTGSCGTTGTVQPPVPGSISSNTTGVCTFFVRNAAQVALTFLSDGSLAGTNDTYDLILDFSTAPSGLSVMATNNGGVIKPLEASNCKIGNLSVNCLFVSFESNMTDLNTGFANRVLMVNPSSFGFTNITTNASTAIKGSATHFHTLVVNTAGTTSTATIFNNASCSGAKIATVNTSSLNTFVYDIQTTIGLCITTAGAAAADITVTSK